MSFEKDINKIKIWARELGLPSEMLPNDETLKLYVVFSIKNYLIKFYSLYFKNFTESTKQCYGKLDKQNKTNKGHGEYP